MMSSELHDHGRQDQDADDDRGHRSRLGRRCLGANPHAGALPGTGPGRAPCDQLPRRLPAMAFRVSSKDFFGGSS